MTQQVMEPKYDSRDPETPVDTRPKGRGSYILLALFALVLAVGGTIGVVSRLSEARALAKETDTLAIQNVVVVQPKPEAPRQELVLPSTLQAYTESPIYARTNGYLGKWYRDIGSRVEKGQILAEIETPEIDQELMQARAARDQATAQLALAKTSAQRWESLQKMDAVAQQETDERSSGFVQGQAALAASSANVRRLEQLESFKHVYAPFSGVITKRNIDIGALINAGNQGTNQELFDIARIDPIRVYINVPELYAPSIRSGVRATIELSSLEGKQFSGSVVRTSESIDPATRTLLTEVDVANPQYLLLPGAYAQVHLALVVRTPGLSLPVNALLFRAEGPRAAVVDAQGEIHLKAVIIGRDYGTAVQILGGLAVTDSVVLNPGDALEDGEHVHVSKGNS